MKDSYVPNLKIPGQKKPSGKMWVTIALCVLLPPVGMILLWGKTRCPIRGKILLTAVSVAVMAVIITLVMQYGANVKLRQSVYTTAAPTPYPTVVPAQLAQTPVPAPGQETELPDGVIPANPAA